MMVCSSVTVHYGLETISLGSTMTVGSSKRKCKRKHKRGGGGHGPSDRKIGSNSNEIINHLMLRYR